MIGAIDSVTLGVGDRDAALRLYRDVIGFRVDAQYPLSASLRSLWSLPADTDGALMELSANGYPVGRLRLLALSPVPTLTVRSDDKRTGTDTALDIGPKAIDFYVKAPIANAVRLIEEAGYPPRSPPIRHELDGMVSEELVFTGPDDVPILLMVGHLHTAAMLRPGSPEQDFSEIATISVVGGDVERSRAFYRDALGLTTVTDAVTGPAWRDLVCDLTGVPRGTDIHFLVYAGAAEPSGKILVMHFGGLSKRRLTGRMHPRNRGFVLLTHRTADLDTVVTRLEQAGFGPLAGPASVDYGGRRRRALIVRGPNEELLEIIEDNSRI
jgi:catechol 2,3-dioxygenase-like lactoylglutathione lyase family enzyme